MPTKLSAYNAVCQSCLKRFKINKSITTVVNLDYISTTCNDFWNNTLNKVCCPHCSAEFTYETDVLVISERLKLFCLVNPHLDYTGIKRAPYILTDDDVEYRYVRYLSDAREKFRIKKDGISDRLIEYIKLKSFSDNDVLPYDEKSVVYVSSDKDKYLFVQTDFNDNILQSFEVVYPTDDVPAKALTNASNNKTWQRIDRTTI